MTLIQVISVVVLLGAFVVGSKWTINMGLVMLLGASVIAYFGGASPDVIASSFPTSTFMLIVGITYFFAVVESSKTMDFIVASLLRLVRGSIAVVPFILFGLSALAVSMGAYQPAVAALIIPVAMRLARDYGINRFLMAIMVIHGILAGNFGPLATSSIITGKLLTDAGIEPINFQLFITHLVTNAVVAGVAYFMFGGAKLIRAGRIKLEQPASVTVGGGNTRGGVDYADSDIQSSSLPQGTLPPRQRPNRYQIATLVALVCLVVGALGFKLNIGYTALALGLVLTLCFERKHNTFVNKMPWGVILMLTGVLVYFGVLTEIGTIDAISDFLSSLGSDTAAVLTLSMLSGIISAFASSLTVIGASLQLSIPLISPDLSTLAVVGPVTVSSTIVDASPFGIVGALSLAAVEPEVRVKMMRSMMMWAAAMIVIGPPLAWFVLTVL